MSGFEQSIRYGGWSRDRQGWLLGLTGGAWTVIVLTGLPVLTAVGAHQWLTFLALLPVWALAVALVTVPIRGRPALRWLRDLVLHAIGGVMRWSSWTSRAVTGDVSAVDEVQLPGVLTGLRLVEGPPYGPQLERAVLIQDRAARTWAAVARIVHPGIGLAEPAARAQMAAGLADLLEGAATAELVSLLAIQVRTIPDDGAERVNWQRQNVHPGAPPVALLVNEQLEAAMLTAGVRHEAFVTVVVPESRLTRQAKDAGGGVDGRARVLHSVMSEVQARLTGAVGCSSATWLTSPELAAVIRTGFAPGDRGGLTEAT